MQTVDMDEDIFYRALGERIARRRKELRLRQIDLAKEIGLSRASIANIEVGRQKVVLHQVYHIAEALSIDDIVELLPRNISNRNPERISILETESLTDEQIEQIRDLFKTTTSQ